MFELIQLIPGVDSTADALPLRAELLQPCRIVLPQHRWFAAGCQQMASLGGQRVRLDGDAAGSQLIDSSQVVGDLVEALAQRLDYMAAVAAVVTTVLAFPVAWVAVRCEGFLARTVEGANYVTSSLPGIVTALVGFTSSFAVVLAGLGADCTTVIGVDPLDRFTRFVEDDDLDAAVFARMGDDAVGFDIDMLLMPAIVDPLDHVLRLREARLEIA